jgi:hypothetical protein
VIQANRCGCSIGRHSARHVQRLVAGSDPEEQRSMHRPSPGSRRRLDAGYRRVNVARNCRLLRITRRRVKSMTACILAGADPLVGRRPWPRLPASQRPRRRQRRAVDLQAARVGAHDRLAVAGDEMATDGSGSNGLVRCR